MLVNIMNVVLFGVFAGYLFMIYKKGTNLKLLIEKSFNNLDSYLKHRYELIPLLLENIKRILQTEEKILIKLRELVKYDYSTLTKEEKLKLNGRITTGLEKLFRVTTVLDVLNNDAEFCEVKKKIEDLNNDIEKTKKSYNWDVNQYNKYLQALPNGIFTPLFKFDYEETFENVSEKLKTDNTDV